MLLVYQVHTVCDQRLRVSTWSESSDRQYREVDDGAVWPTLSYRSPGTELINIPFLSFSFPFPKLILSGTTPIDEPSRILNAPQIFVIWSSEYHKAHDSFQSLFLKITMIVARSVAFGDGLWVSNQSTHRGLNRVYTQSDCFKPFLYINWLFQFYISSFINHIYLNHILLKFLYLIL